MTSLLHVRLALLPRLQWIGSLTALVVLGGVLINCSGSGSVMTSGGMAAIQVSITDPPSCKFPNGDFQHFYVTIRSVQAHTSASADDNTPGWQELAPQLNSQRTQDLRSHHNVRIGGCGAPLRSGSGCCVGSKLYFAAENGVRPSGVHYQ
jgi:hypothetical protein